jgi:hypothetical protein
VQSFTISSDAGLPARIELPASQTSLSFRDAAGNCYAAENNILELPAGKFQLTAI